MKMTKKRIAAAIAMGALTLCALFVIFAVASTPRPSIGTLVEDLESNKIQMGHTDDVDLGARSIVEYTANHFSGDTYFVRMYYSKGVFVTLYSENGILFAAQYAQGMFDVSKIKWYFLDDDKLTRFNSIAR